MSVQTEDVQITSASVEINTLRVSGRQLTLRTFRQLQRGTLINAETHDFREEVSTIWGWVNYFWDGNNKADIHAVFQEGNKLYRQPLYRIQKSCTDMLSIGNLSVRGPTPRYMRTPMLKRIAEQLEERIKMHNLSWEDGHDTDETLQRIKNDEWFRKLNDAIQAYNQCIDVVEEKGQLFIAT